MRNREIELGFVLISIINVTYFIGRMILNPIQPLFFVEVGASTVQLGIIMAIPSLVGIPLRIPFSTLMNRFGKWTIVLFSNVISAVSMLAYAFTYQVRWLYPIGVLGALSFILYQPASHSLALDLSPSEKRAQLLGWYLAMTGVAMLIGPLLASYFTLFLSYRIVFLISAVPCIFGILAVLLAQVRRLESRESRYRRRIRLVDLKRDSGY